MRCWPQQGAQGPGQPNPLSSWNQRALDSNTATPADSMRVGASLFTFLRLSFPDLPGTSKIMSRKHLVCAVCQGVQWV